MRDHTVKQLAELSGVSIRALHYYDEIGLLKPAHIGGNGYRYYGREELLRLQQILFHRELGFPLGEIGKILDAPDFDQAAALRSHRQRLQGEVRRYKRLIQTIDDTLAQIEGDTPMNEKAFYKGLDPKRWAAQDQWAIDRYGSAAEASIKRRNDLMSGWTEADGKRIIGGFQAIRAEFVVALSQNRPADSNEVRAIARRFLGLLNETAPAPLSKAGFLNAVDAIAGNPHFRCSLEAQSQGLADYVVGAMRAFSEEIV
ncbi:MerR family transcriptional regulator [Mesorhizobium sp. NPDC059054]|uniref:MerR family transcriptional regulator n=1 Tax=Mesorhizobium sp. NPDC059054 TaxID=3346711 RepID=UPI0036990572